MRDFPSAPIGVVKLVPVGLSTVGRSLVVMGFPSTLVGMVSTDDAVTLVEAMLFTSQLRRAAVSGHDWCAELTDIHAHFSDRRYDRAVVVSKCPGPPEPLRSG